MHRKLRNGREDGLEPLQPLDVTQTASVAELLDGMARTAFGGRQLGEALQVLREMVADPRCTIIVTLSGAMTVAKMGRVLCTMIEEGFAHLVVSTGALMAHGLSEAIGGVHYKHREDLPDDELYQRGYNRVYDTLELETSLDQGQAIVSAVLDRKDWERPVGSFEIHRALGEHLYEQGHMPSVLGCAYRADVPVYVPAFTDSELGLAVAAHALAGRPRPSDGVADRRFFSEPPAVNAFLDLYDFTRRVLTSDTLGIFTIGGGVPRNWGQQVGPFVELLNSRIGTDFEVPRIRYGVRICPEPVHWGGLSGCTYSEGLSWGKFVAPEEGGRFAEVPCDATIAWPLLVRALLEGRGSPPDGAAPDRG